MTVETLGRAVGLYRRTALTRSAFALLLANAIPVVGVLFFDWSLITILVLYWLENGIVGFWNVLRIALARGSLIPDLPDLTEAAVRRAGATPEQSTALVAAWRQAKAAQDAARAGALAPESSAAGPASPPGASALLGRLSIIPRAGLSIFFLVHYGLFWFVHGVFVFALPAFAGFGDGDVSCVGAGLPVPGEIDAGFGDLACGAGSFGAIAWGPVLIGAGALFLSHGASFLLNYLGRGEYLRLSPAHLMTAPYARVIVLHLTIILGGMIVAFLGAPIGALIVLVALKTAFDLGLHRREHEAAAG